MPPHYSYNKYQCLIKSHYSLASTCLSNNPPHILPLLLTTLQSLEFPDSLNVQCFLLLLSHFSRCFLSPKIPSVLSCPTLCLTTYSSDFRSQFNFLFLPKTFSENQVQVRYFCSSHPWCSLITSMVCLIKFNCNCFFFFWLASWRQELYLLLLFFISELEIQNTCLKNLTCLMS